MAVSRTVPAPSPHSPLRISRGITRAASQVFWTALLLRVTAVVVIFLTDAIRTLELSRDSLKYDAVGKQIARELQYEPINWVEWIDDGWFQFIGLVYYLFGEHMILIQLFNVLLGALGALLVFRVALLVYRELRIAKFAGYLFALFPSFVYWSALPLKDTFGIFCLLLMVYALVRLRERFDAKYLAYAALSVIGLVAIREYMFVVATGLAIVSLAPLAGRQVARYLLGMVGVVIVIGSLGAALGLGFLGLDFFEESQYFDLEYINQTRETLNRGNTAFFEDASQAAWGQNLFNDIQNAALSAFYFFFSIDVTNVGRARQLMALPEMLALFIAIPALVAGVLTTWREHRHRALPVIIFGFGVMAVFTSATTNMGALFRWRMQALPFFLIMLAYGVYVRRKGLLYGIFRRVKV